MVFLCGRAGGEDDVMPEEHKETPTTKPRSSQPPRTQSDLYRVSCPQGFHGRTPLTCTFGKSEVVQTVWTILLFPAESHRWRWGLSMQHTPAMTLKKNPTPNIIPAIPESLRRSRFLCRTVFKLLAHDGARRGGHVVRGVLLGVGGRDDGHQVVSVRGVYLQTRRDVSIAWLTPQTKETVFSPNPNTFLYWALHQNQSTSNDGVYSL